MYQYLTSEIWQMLGSQESQRGKAEALSEFLYLTLDLRLPTEQTLGMMTALVVCIDRQIQPFDLQTALQLTRSSWKSVFKRLERNAARIELLPMLPRTFAELPAHIQGRLVNVAAREVWLLTEGELDILMRRVRLRANSNQGDSGDAAQLLAHSLLALLPGGCGRRLGAKQNEVQLRNLQIFSPKRGATHGRPALPAASASASSHMKPGGGVGSGLDGLLALEDSPAEEPARVRGILQPTGLENKGGPAGSGEGGPAGSGEGGPARSVEGGPVGSGGCGPARAGFVGPAGSVPAGSVGVAPAGSAPAGESCVPLRDMDRKGTGFESPRAAQRGEHGPRPEESPVKASLLGT